MTRIVFGKLYGRMQEVAVIGEWLEQNMPNPPLPEPQRWTIWYGDWDDVKHCVGIDFETDEDAFFFSLRWA